MKPFSLCATLLLLVTTVSDAKQGAVHYSVREKKAACSVAVYHLLYKEHYLPDEVRMARKKGFRLERFYIEAVDETGREVTPAALIRALRRKGVNAHPAWTEKKWRRAHDPRGLAWSHGISLTQLEVLADGRIRWHSDNYSYPGPNANADGSLSRGTIELRKQKGTWKVVKYFVSMAAG